MSLLYPIRDRVNMLRTICRSTIFLVTLVGSGSLQLAQGITKHPNVDQIISLALERVEYRSSQNLEEKFVFQLLNISEKLDKKARSTQVEKRLFEVLPIGGVSYERLLEKNGQPLGKDDLKAQRRKEAKFRHSLNRGKAQENSDSNEVQFNRELVERYRFCLEGIKQFRGRNTFILSFKPRRERLPVRRRIDRALNNSKGRIWVDQESYEISRVEFELMKKVPLWWGVVGSISQVQGLMERREIENNIWFPSCFKFYMKGRILFRSLHSRRQSSWSNFQRVGEFLE